MSVLQRARPLHRLALLGGVTAVYILAGKLGLTLASLHPSATAVWPPTGIAIALLLLLGRQAWPAVLVGAFVVNVTTFGTALSSAAIAVGNTLEAVIGAGLTVRWAAGRLAFTRSRHVARYTLLAGVLATAVSATWGVTAVCVTGLAPWSQFRDIWLTWWLGDAAGALVVAPLIVLWSVQRAAQWERSRIIDATVLGIAMGVVGIVVFGPAATPAEPVDPLEFFCIPIVLWVAFRFGPRATATVTAILSAIAVTATLASYGPFVRATPNESLVLLQAFTVILAAMGLIVAASVAERRRAEDHLRDLSATDSLTGIANHRRLMQVLEEERRRSQRTSRTFAFVLLDMDGLKQINDRFGHLAGSRALVRLALALRQCCRAVDTPARMGGDEFGIVLPEANEHAAHRLVQRIHHTLSHQTEQPAVRVSAGVAVFPADGESVDALMTRADGALYAAKPHTSRKVG